MKAYLFYFKDFGFAFCPFTNGFDLVLLFITISVDFKKNGEQYQGEDTEA